MNKPVLEVLEKSETLADRVRSAMRKALIEGAFAPGERIKIRDVAKSMGISPTPAREALTTLIAEGALVEDENKTAVVPALTRESLIEITELRVALETTAARLVLPLLTDQDIEYIRSHDMTIVHAAGKHDMKSALRANATFHFSIYRRLEAPLILRMIETIWLRSGAYLSVAHNAFDVFQKSGTKHQAIVEALRSRDAGKVAHAIEDDIRSSANVLIAGLDQHLSKIGGQKAASHPDE